MQELLPFTDHELVRGYVHEAVWFWFDASTVEMSFQAGLHRLMARCIGEELRRRGLDQPDDDWVYAFARNLFPPDDLRPRHG